MTTIPDLATVLPGSRTVPPDAGQRWQMLEGEALATLQALPDGCAAAIITDPPYSSGGFTRGDRMGSTTNKYVLTGTQVERPDFAGDNRDQRGYLKWCIAWLDEALRVTRPGGSLLMFTDWRQLPTTTDAVQAGGWVWRGIVPWDKGDGTRPRRGGFRSQAEYVVWATAGGLRDDVDACLPGWLHVLRPPTPTRFPSEQLEAAAIVDGYLSGAGAPFDGWHHIDNASPDLLREVIKQLVDFHVGTGWIHAPVTLADKHHITGKPTELMRELVKLTLPGELIVDPFAGSGTTGVAALLEHRRFIGSEKIPHYAELARERLRAVEVAPTLFDPPAPVVADALELDWPEPPPADELDDGAHVGSPT